MPVWQRTSLPSRSAHRRPPGEPPPGVARPRAGPWHRLPKSIWRARRAAFASRPMQTPRRWQSPSRFLPRRALSEPVGSRLSPSARYSALPFSPATYALGCQLRKRRVRVGELEKLGRNIAHSARDAGQDLRAPRPRRRGEVCQARDRIAPEVDAPMPSAYLFRIKSRL